MGAWRYHHRRLGYTGRPACHMARGRLAVRHAPNRLAGLWHIRGTDQGLCRANWASTAQEPALENLPSLGVNATSDAINKLAASSDATPLNHAGDGHHLKLNKATSTDTASLLYQSGFSGRAEMGLSGNDDFSIKVSGDGTNFTTALAIDAATGLVTLPATPSRQMLQYAHRHYLYSDLCWTGPAKVDRSMRQKTSAQGPHWLPTSKARASFWPPVPFWKTSHWQEASTTLMSAIWICVSSPNTDLGTEPGTVTQTPFKPFWN